MFRELVVASWNILGEMSPYLLLGFFIAGILSIWLSPALIERHLGGYGIMPIFKAALFGVPLPLCSCSVIPVSVSLYKHGASRSAVTSFLLSTPQTGVDSILATYALMGLTFAVFRPIAALITGIIGGILVLFFTKHDKEEIEITCEHCCHSKRGLNKLLYAFKHGFISLPRDIGWPLFIGVAIAALVTVLVPAGSLSAYLGGGIIAMLVMMAIGIPIYVCATASIPIAIGFIHMGASPGAALAFLIAGPATNAATIITIGKSLGIKTAILYLLTVAISALLSGLCLDFIFPNMIGSMPQFTEAHHSIQPWYYHLSAIVIIALIFGSYFFKEKHSH